MNLLDQDLKIKTSTLPDSGKGLFTKIFIPKGTLITEHTGKISTWDDANHDDGNNQYIYYVSRNHVIDAKDHDNSFARFVNDAEGFKKITGITNNAKYIVKDKRVFLKTVKDVQPGEEIFVAYGKQYWDVVKKNKIL